eukprot:3144258-Pleurochrysis_carterae.AAC.4
MMYAQAARNESRRLSEKMSRALAKRLTQLATMRMRSFELSVVRHGTTDGARASTLQYYPTSPAPTDTTSLHIGDFNL